MSATLKPLHSSEMTYISAPSCSPLALMAAAGLGAAAVFCLGGAPRPAEAAGVHSLTLAAAPALDGTKAPGSKKDSPYAAAKEETAAPTPEPLAGTKAPGSEKQSPYAAAKDTVVALTPSLGKLWGLLVPIVLAAGSYLYLRSSETDQA
jgi:hypothetical protein